MKKQQVPPLRYAPVGMTLLFIHAGTEGREDISVAAFWRKTFPGRVRGTADPSTSLGMTKGWVALSGMVG